MRAALLYGADDFVAEWVRRRLPQEVRPFTDHTAVGVVLPGENGSHRIVAGVVWNMYYGHSIEVTFAAESPKWASRRVLAELFAYPFCQLNVARVTAVTGRKNAKARELLTKLGFVYEGMARKGYSRTEDAAIYGMLKRECRWLRDQGDDAPDGTTEGLRERRRAANRQRSHAGASALVCPDAGSAAATNVGADAHAAATAVPADGTAPGRGASGPAGRPWPPAG